MHKLSCSCRTALPDGNVRQSSVVVPYPGPPSLNPSHWIPLVIPTSLIQPEAGGNRALVTGTSSLKVEKKAPFLPEGSVVCNLLYIHQQRKAVTSLVTRKCSGGLCPEEKSPPLRICEMRDPDSFQGEAAFKPEHRSAPTEESMWASGNEAQPGVEVFGFGTQPSPLSWGHPD
ncbi:hypothetical protein E5288_WYG012397 [Bos mutus]|uniref:Uncharacterized protein n=1 Tax=Bos mutus TaxID=72004 RepID=A0A6B0RPT9_9CETA|nr:hypothetical protein [Bos mutus]